MTILIIGASSKTSIGFLVGEQLREQNNWDVVYASRSGNLGFVCDITSDLQVRTLLMKIKPDVVLVCAGVFATPKKLGNMEGWGKVEEHLLAKSLGVLLLANAIQAMPIRTRLLIALGGREISEDPGFAVYTASNGALWASLRFINRHNTIKGYYLDLPFVRGSTMEKYFPEPKTINQRIGVEEITTTVQKIIQGKIKRSRIILGKEGCA